MYIAVSSNILWKRFMIGRPWAEWRTQFLDEMASLAALHINRHSMAAQRR